MATSKRSNGDEMGRLKLFYRLMVRPMVREPVRMALTILAVAIGVAVVLAIELAGNAAAGSFHASMETLAGDYTFEIVAVGGVPESVVGMLATQPVPLQYSARIEDYATIVDSKETVPLIGIDLIAEGSRFASASQEHDNSKLGTEPREFLNQLEQPTSIWVSATLKKKPGDTIELLINDQTEACTVRGVYSDSDTNGDAIVMDLAGAERALKQSGHVDRILLKLPQGAQGEEWRKRIVSLLPSGVELRPQGTGTAENRKMLAAFRWNLRLLSYIALVVGAFLIYNTISISVVRRRAEIGIVRALGASRRDVLVAFLGEATAIGLAGALLGILLGRLLASGAVKLIALTVDMLYVSSRPGTIALSGDTIALALLIGVGVSIASALGPAREAMQVSPIDAMARGGREYAARLNKGRDLAIAVILGVLAALLSRLPAVGGKPLFGYVAAIFLIVAMAYAIPAVVNFVSSATTELLRRLIGVEAMLASRSLVGSLGRTSVLVGALATAVAMMTAVAIMVGSFRQTVVSWMDHQLPADLYLRPAGNGAADWRPKISLELVEKIAKLPGVAAVDRLRAYQISYQGLPITVAGMDARVLRPYDRSNFFSGRPAPEVLSELLGHDNVLVSEPFTYKHHVQRGDSIELTLGESRARFRIVDVYYDYSSERGTILMDRGTLLKYLPDPTVSNLAIFVEPSKQTSEVRREILQTAEGHHILITNDRELRAEAIRVFDRTFAITYALEAVAVLVAVMGIAGALLAVVIDRRRELGLLRFLGASSAQIQKLILVEAALLGLLANVAGFVLGYFLSLILVFVINKQSFGWTIRFHWPVAVLCGALTVVYVATVFAGLYPAEVAVKLNPLEVVHEE
ncbi:MAG: FtsX-like permease family protein [Candidatus Acidiferrum sp.]